MRSKIFFVALAVISLCAYSAQAGIILSSTQVASPAASLDAYVVTATATGGLNVGAIAGLSISGAHQVWQNAVAGAAAQTPALNNLSGTFWDPANNDLDTHLLVATNDPLVNLSPGYSLTETNSGLDEAGVGPLPGPSPFQTFTAQVGLGSLSNALSTDQITFLGSAQTPSKDFLYLVLPHDGEAFLTVNVLDTTPAFNEFTQFRVGPEEGQPTVPEPASLVLAGLATIGFIGLRRRG
jgi:PEP-CTERM motif